MNAEHPDINARMYREICKKMPNAYVVLRIERDEDGGFSDLCLLDSNDKVQAITGLTELAIQGKRVFADLGEYAAPLKETFAAVVEKGESKDFEWHFDASGKHVRFFIFLLDNEHLAVVLNDESPLKASERVLEAQGEALEQKVEERTRELRNNEYIMRALIDGQSEGILLLATDGTIIELNKSAQEQSALSRDALIGASYFSVYPLRDAMIQKGKFNECLRSGHLVRFEEERAEGVFFQYKFSPIFFDKDNLSFVLLSSYDISHYKGLLKQMRFSEDMAQVLLNIRDDACMLFSATGEVLAVNEEACREIGADVKTILGKRVADVFPAGYTETIEERLERARKTCETEYYEDVDPSGRVFEITVRPLFDVSDEVDRIAIFVRNITKQKETEHYLRRLHNLEQIVNHMSRNFISSPAERMDEIINAALKEIGEFFAVERVYVALFEKETTHASMRYEWVPPGVASVKQAYQRIEIPPDAHALERLRKIKSVYMSQSLRSVSPTDWAWEIFDAAKLKSLLWVPISYGMTLLGVLGVSTKHEEKQWFDEEISAMRFVTSIFAIALMRKQTEDALMNYANELERSNAEIKGFNQIITHDLRAPLANIKGFSAETAEKIALLQEIVEENQRAFDEADYADIKQILFEKVPRYLGYMQSSTEKMERLTDSVLKWFRLGKRDLVMEYIDMNALMHSIIEATKSTVHAHNIDIRVEKLPSLRADKDALSQIFSNLLDNAIKYLKPDRAGRIWVTSDVRDEFVCYHVRDNGRGMKERDTEKIFSMFRRVGEQNAAGEGIGLAYVKTLVEKHGGTIECVSEFEKGSTFTVCLPRRQ